MVARIEDDRLLIDLRTVFPEQEAALAEALAEALRYELALRCYDIGVIIGGSMATALIHLDEKQKRRLTLRAKKVGRSFSQEVRNAVDLYLDLPVESEEELSMLARAANESATRSVKRMDETIAYVERILKSMRKTK